MDTNAQAVVRHHSGTAIIALGVLVVAFLSFWLPLIIGLTIVWGSPQL